MVLMRYRPYSSPRTFVFAAGVIYVATPEGLSERNIALDTRLDVALDLARKGRLAKGLLHQKEPDGTISNCALGFVNRAWWPKGQGIWPEEPFFVMEDICVLAAVMNELWPERAYTDRWESNFLGGDPSPSMTLRHGPRMTLRRFHPQRPEQTVAFVNNHPATTLQDIIMALEIALERRRGFPPNDLSQLEEAAQSEAVAVS